MVVYEYNIKNPTRVDLAGGLLDIWPVHALVRDCFVVNFSIPVFTSVELRYSAKAWSRESGGGNPDHFIKENSNYFDRTKINIGIFSPSGSYKKSFVGLNDLFKTPSSELSLLKKHLEYWSEYFIEKQTFPNSICLKSESPMGGGLGASSSLCVGLAKSFCSLLKKELTQSELLVLCRDLETSLLHAPAGIQDYIPAIESEPGFLYIIECAPLGPQWSRKKIPINFFKDHFLLVDTGKSHHSGNNNWEILKKVVEKDQETLNGIYQLRNNALKTMKVCEQEDWPDLSSCLSKEQELRGEYFSNWLNPSVSSLIDLMTENGAEAVKLCGAGGGGCLLVLAKNRIQKQKLAQVCKKNKIPIIMNW